MDFFCNIVCCTSNNVSIVTSINKYIFKENGKIAQKGLIQKKNAYFCANQIE
jgi:hypothetical protein